MIRPVTPTVALLALLLAAPAGAAVAVGEPSLTVAVNNDVTEVRPGDTVEYVAVFENTGSEDFEGTATITPPAFLTLESDVVSAENGALSWPVSLAPGERFDVTAIGTVGEEFGDAYQVVVLASIAAADAPTQILARAADADRIAGTEAPPVVPGLEEPAGPFPWLPIAVTAGVLLLIPVAVLVVVVRLRRRAVA